MANTASGSPQVQLAFKSINVFGDIPFGGRLVQKQRMVTGHLVIWFFLGILPLSAFYLTTFFDHNLTIPGSALGLFEDFAFLVILLYVPLTVSLAITHFPNLDRTFHQLRAVIEFEGDETWAASVNSSQYQPISLAKFNNLLADSEELINGRGRYFKWKVVSVFCGLGYVALAAWVHWNATANYGFDIWSSQSYPLSFALRTALETVLFGLLLPCIVYKMVMILVSIKRLCTSLSLAKALRLSPLHPDKAGGLGVLGKFGLRMATLLVPSALGIAVYIVANGMKLTLAVASLLFVGLLIFTFFYPLSGAHESMKASKNKELDYLAGEFNRVYYRLVTEMRGGNTGKMGVEASLLNDLDGLYRKAERMPVWPFDNETLRRFLSIPGALLSTILLQWILKHL